MSYLIQLPQVIESAVKDAVSTSGCSDILFESKCQKAFSEILSAAPEEYREATESLLRAAGYNPDQEPFVPGDGECSLTGIDTDCCPCGRHP